MTIVPGLLSFCRLRTLCRSWRLFFSWDGFFIARISLFLFFPLLLLLPKASAIWIFLAVMGMEGERFYRQRKWSSLPWKRMGPLWAFLGWGALSSLWSLDAGYTLQVVGRLGLILGAGIYLRFQIQDISPTLRVQMQNSLVAGFALMWGVFALEVWNNLKFFEWLYQKPVSLETLNPFASILALSSWVVVESLVQRHQKVLGSFCVLFCGVVLLFLESESSFLAYLAAGITWGLVFFFEKTMLYVISGAVIIFLVTAPLFPTYVLNPKTLLELCITYAPPFSCNSLIHRFYVWEFTRDQALKKPLLGHGLGSTKDISLRNKKVTWFYPDPRLPPEHQLTTVNAMPNHPHNLFLQLWFELGSVGVVFMGLFLGCIPVYIQRCFKSRSIRASMAATYITALIIGNTAYGAWQNWWIATLISVFAFWYLFQQNNAPFSSRTKSQI